MELNEQRRDSWEVVRKYDNQPFVQIAAHKEIHALTISILNLYETLPLIPNNNSNALSNVIYEDTTSLFLRFLFSAKESEVGCQIILTCIRLFVTNNRHQALLLVYNHS